MQSRQVYGRRATAKQTITYAKFISPDKDDVSAGKKRKNPTKKAATPAREDDIDTIEKELGGLKIGTDDVGVVGISENKKSTRSHKAAGNKAKTKDSEGFVQVTENSNKMRLEKDDTGSKAMTTKRRPRRVAAEPIGGAETKNESARARETAGEQTSQPPDADQQTKTPPPTRGRKPVAVRIPKRTPSPPAMSSLPTPDPTPEPQDEYTAHVSPLLPFTYDKSICSFGDWSSALGPHFEVSKIAEASFSEVYRLKATSTTSESANESVLKLVALKSPKCLGSSESWTRKSSRNQEDEDQWKSEVNDVLSEVNLLQNLNYIPGFTNFRELTIIQGRPSRIFIDAWKAWNKSRPRGRKSEFPDPSRKASYDDNQLWAVIEMQDAGTDCEKLMEAGGMNTVWEVWDVFWSLCLSVAKAEEACRFEHRDLHLENICIRSSRSRADDDLTLPIIKEPNRRKLGFTGLETTVIDYTLSRADILPSLSRSSTSLSSLSDASISLGSSPCRPSTTPEVAYLDLNKDEGLFNGDATEEYQYEIYRYMRGIVLHNDPLRSDPNTYMELDTPRRSPRKTAQHIIFDEEEPTPRRSPRKQQTDQPYTTQTQIWRHFHPKTNLIWAHFIIYNLLLHLEDNEPAKLSNKQIMRNVEARPEDTGKVVKKANKLYERLERVAHMLEPEALAGKDSLGSMKELVVWALERGWLGVDDVTG